MIKRKEEQNINQWINSTEKTALLITGARQVGKTFLIRHCLSQYSGGYAELI